MFAEELQRLHASGQLKDVKTINKAVSDPFDTKPVGADATTILLISFATQTAAAVTAEIIKRYLIDRLGGKAKETDISVDNIDDPS